jgi:3-oxoacyl-[acyl-carrier-protein] synthase-3
MSGVAGILPSRSQSLGELAAAGLLSSSPQTLADLGFERAHVCDPGIGPEQMAFDAAQAALRDAALDPEDVDAVIWASARPEGHVVGSRSSRPPISDTMAGFRYTSAWLQHELCLVNAEVMAVAQQGCTTMFSALRFARVLLAAEPARFEHVLCVGTDVLPAGAPREILYNVISDGACAVVMSRGCSEDVWLAYQQISRGYYWDPAARGPEIIAAYFPTAKRLVQQLLSDHALEPNDVDVVIPTGVNHASWDLLLRLIGVPGDRLYRGPSFGHTMTSDSFLYLEALRRTGYAPRGAHLLLFTFGFGSNWSALLLEH